MMMVMVMRIMNGDGSDDEELCEELMMVIVNGNDDGDVMNGDGSDDEELCEEMMMGIVNANEDGVVMRSCARKGGRGS